MQILDLMFYLKFLQLEYLIYINNSLKNNKKVFKIVLKSNN